MSSRADRARLQAIANVLATSPGLGAFTVSVALLGLDGAVDLCETRNPTPRLAALWDSLGYTITQLPTSDDIRCLLFGVEAARRQDVVRGSRKDVPSLFVLASDMGCSPLEINRGFKLMESYGSELIPRVKVGRTTRVL